MTDKFLKGLLEGGLIFVKRVAKFTPTASGIYLPKELEGYTFRFILVPADEAVADLIKEGKKLTRNAEHLERKRIEKEVVHLKEQMDILMSEKNKEKKAATQVPEQPNRFKINFGGPENEGK